MTTATPHTTPATPPPPPPPPPLPGAAARRSGAAWLAGVGAAMLFGAAAVFIAVRWDQMGPGAKLAVIVGFTVAVFGAARAAEDRLPATSLALVHLGAVLVPVDVAAIGIQLGWSWPTMLGAISMSSTASALATAQWVDSVTLHRVAWVSVVGSVAGIGALSPIPAPLLLAVVAFVGWRGGSVKAPVGWAIVAGCAPLAHVVSPVGADALGAIGIADAAGTWTAVLTGAFAAATLGLEGLTRKDAGLGAAAVAVAVIGATTTWLANVERGDADLVAVALMFVLVEAAAFAGRRTPLWRQGLAVPADVAEVLVGLCLLASPIVVLIGHFEDLTPGYAWAASAGLAGLGFVLADLRRPVAFGVSSAAVPWAFGAATAMAGLSMGVTGLVLGGLGAAVVLLRPHPLTGVMTVAWSTLVVIDLDGAGEVLLPVALVGTVVLSLVALARRVDLRSRVTPQNVGRGVFGDSAAVLLASAMVGCTGGWLADSTFDGLGVVMASTAIVAVAIISDRSCPGIGWLARGAAVVGVLWVVGESSDLGLLAAGAVALAAFADAVMVNEPRRAYLSAVSLSLFTLAALEAAEMAQASAGLTMVIAGLALGAMSLLIPEDAGWPQWKAPVLVSAGLHTFFGLVLSTADGSTFSNSLIVLGVAGAVWGVVNDSRLMVHGGVATLTMGIWGRLMLAGVEIPEPYMVPLASQMLLWGLQERTHPSTARPVSSWVAYGPAIVTMTSASLMVRASGGSGWHAVSAGVVGLVAVAVGGSARLGGPLVMGTVVLAAVTSLETLAYVPLIPTWAWLALGGSTLLVIAVLLERNDTSPAVAGRRVIEVITRDFT